MIIYVILGNFLKFRLDLKSANYLEKMIWKVSLLYFSKRNSKTCISSKIDFLNGFQIRWNSLLYLALKTSSD